MSFILKADKKETRIINGTTIVGSRPVPAHLWLQPLLLLACFYNTAAKPKQPAFSFQQKRPSEAKLRHSEPDLSKEPPLQHSPAINCLC